MEILKKGEEDARLLDRCETKRKERAKHWQCNESVQIWEDKLWKNEELKKSEEALPRQKRVRFGIGFETVQGENRSRMRWLPPKNPLDLVEQSVKCPQQACTTMFFLIPKNITSERPIALMPTLIRSWEALRALEVAKWQQKCGLGRYR